MSGAERLASLLFRQDRQWKTTRDETGIDLPDEEAARKHVAKILPDLAHSGLPDGDMHSFASTVRDEAGQTIYHAELTYHGRRLGPAKT